LAWWKMHVRTLMSMLVLPVQLLIRALVHLPLLVKVGILGFPVFAFFVLVIPGLTMHLCGYRVLGLGKNKQCGFPKFYVSLLVSLFGGVGVVQAVFAPADRAALKAAVGSCTCTGWNGQIYTSCSCTGGCLGETADGSCPSFAASDDATGHPYGVIGNWDVSAVTNMEQSKCTRVLSLCSPRRLPLWCVVECIRQLEVRRVTSLTRVVFVFALWFETVPSCCCLCGGLVFLFFVAPSLIAVFRYALAFNQDVSKWNTGAVTNMDSSKCTRSPSLWPHAFRCGVFFEYTTTRVSSDHNSHTFFILFCVF
jgi:surface protein